MIRLLYCGIVFLLSCSTALANGSLNLGLPGSYGSYQSDSFRADGLDCSMAIGSSTNVEFGVVGVINRAPNTTITTDPYTNQSRDIGVYGRITIPIGAPRERLDCNELYQLELRKKRMEIMRLEKELQNLKSLKFENSGNK
jgi:hypothetical protein